MPFLKAMFGLKGRLGRLAYFGYLFLAALMIFGSFAISALMVAHLTSIYGPGVFEVRGVPAFMIMLMFLVGFWASVALTVKRLHDFGLSGANMIWISFLEVLAGLWEGSVLGTVLMIISIGITFWLLLAPGDAEANKYGLPSG